MVLFNYQGFSKSSGIYVIFNSYNWRLYIGSTVEFKNRWQQGHVGSLVKNKHQNKFLQADFNKCHTILGHDDFLEFHILEHLPGSSREDRLAVEERWLKIHFDGGKNCYNLCDRAISREGSKAKDREATKQKSSQSKRKWWENISSENRAKLCQSFSKAALGKAKTVETRQKMSIGKTGLKLKPFTKEHKDKLSLSQKGRCLSIEHKNNLKRKYKTNLISPQGEVVTEIIGLEDFCIKHNLTRANLILVMKGKASHHKGWRLVSKENS